MPEAVAYLPDQSINELIHRGARAPIKHVDGWPVLDLPKRREAATIRR